MASYEFPPVNVKDIAKDVLNIEEKHELAYQKLVKDHAAKNPGAPPPPKTPCDYSDLFSYKKKSNGAPDWRYAKCHWLTIYVRDPATGQPTPFIMSFSGVQCSTQAPSEQAELDALNEMRAKKNYPPLKLRTESAQVSLFYYGAPLQMSEDNTTPIRDHEGHFINRLTGEPIKSIPDYAIVLKAFNEWYKKTIMGFKKDQLLVSQNQVAEGSVSTDVPGQLVVKVDTVHYPMQEFVSHQNPNIKMRGVRMTNPIFRIKARHSVDAAAAFPGEIPKVKFYEMGKGGKAELIADEDGNPLVTNLNIHKRLRAGREVKGFIDMSSICVSSMGISAPSKIYNRLIFSGAAARSSELDASKYFDELLFDESDDAQEAHAAVVAPAAAAPPASFSFGGTKITEAEMDALIDSVPE